MLSYWIDLSKNREIIPEPVVDFVAQQDIGPIGQLF